jgi:hypothetical protein
MTKDTFIKHCTFPKLYNPKCEFWKATSMSASGRRLLIGDPGAGLIYLMDNKGHQLHTFEDQPSMFEAAIAISNDDSLVAIGKPEPSWLRDPHGEGVIYAYNTQK